MKTEIEQIKMLSNLSLLSQKEKVETKGGLLLYCEEKRQRFFGLSYTITLWKAKSNGSLLVSVQK